MRVELAGGLGIGKSTLCRALEEIGFNCIYEDLDTNPFLDDCFKNPRDFRFPSQMWFALSKFHEIKKHEHPDLINVLDQAVLNVRAYTKMLFRREEPEAMRILSRCFDYLETQVGRPDLIVHLKCTPAVQLERIRQRERAHEKEVTLEYIEGLQQVISQLVAQAHSDGIAVVTIDTESVYLPDNLVYAEQLAREIAATVYQAPQAPPEAKRLHSANDRSPLQQYVEIADAV